MKILNWILIILHNCQSKLTERKRKKEAELFSTNRENEKLKKDKAFPLP